METILRELEFNQWVLRVNLKDLGGFWIEGYIHTAPTQPFQPEERWEWEEVLAQCEDNPRISHFRRRLAGIKYPVVQIEVPIRLMGYRNYSLTQLRDFFSEYNFYEERGKNEYWRRIGERTIDYLLKEGRKPESRLNKRLRERSYLLSLDELREILKGSEEVRRAPKEKRGIYERTIDQLLGILEVGHPLEVRRKKDETPKVSIPSPLPEEFIKGHYVEGAEISIAPEGSVVRIGEALESLLERKQEVNRLIEEYNTAVGEYLTERRLKTNKGNFTRIRKELDRIFGERGAEEKESGEIEERLKEGVKTVGGRLSEEVVEARKRVEAGLREVVREGEKLGGVEARVEHNEERVDLRFKKDISRRISEEIGPQIEFVRMRAAEEIRKEDWWVVDWENFEFGTENEEITLGAMGVFREGKLEEGRIKSRYRVGKERVRGFRIEEGWGSSQEIVESTRDEFRASGASVAVAYNVVYDYLEPRKYGDFGIGSLGREPRKVSTVKFFERVGIPARDVLDPLRWAKARYDFLPNVKLVTVAGKIEEERRERERRERERGERESGEEERREEREVRKAINYRQGRELERGRRTGQWEHLSEDTIRVLEDFHGEKWEEMRDKEGKTGELLCSYAGKDLEMLVGIMRSQSFQDNFEDVGFMSELFGVDFFLLFHSPKRVDRFLDREYFKKGGTWRTEMMPVFEDIMKSEERARSHFGREKAKVWGRPKERGFFEKVYKIYIPRGKLFRREIDLFLQNYIEWEKRKRFYNYVDGFEGDKGRRYFLAKYENALFDWVYKDYIGWCYNRHEYEGLKKKLRVKDGEGLEHKLKRLYEEIENRARDSRETGILRRLRKSKADQETLREGCKRTGWDYKGEGGGEEGLEERELQALFNLWLKKRNREKRILATYNIDGESLEAKFNEVYGGLRRFLEEGGFKVVQAENEFLYVQGDREKLLGEGCPFILVDELEKVYVTEHASQRRREAEESGKKIYYPRLGFWEGLEIEEEGSYRLSTFEIRAYGDFLEKIFAGKVKEGREKLEERLRELRERRVDKKELVWYSKAGGRYIGLEGGERVEFYDWGEEEMEVEEGKGYFVRRKVRGKEYKCFRKLDGEKERYYVMEPKAKREEDELGRGSYEVEWVRREIMEVEELEVDWEGYYKRVGERAEILLEPLVGRKEARAIVWGEGERGTEEGTEKEEKERKRGRGERRKGGEREEGRGEQGELFE